MSVEIFCCYARKDQVFLNDLRRYLVPLQREGHITLWADTDIDAGAEWEKEIEKHLDTADIILLLVSPHFISSEYCYSIEMQKALERHNRGEARVIPIIFSPIYWQNAPFGKLQALPTSARPITNWRNRKAAFFDVAEGIRKAVEDTLTQPPKNGKDEVLPLVAPHSESTSQLLFEAETDLTFATEQKPAEESGEGNLDEQEGYLQNADPELVATEEPLEPVPEAISFENFAQFASTSFLDIPSDGDTSTQPQNTEQGARLEQEEQSTEGGDKPLSEIDLPPQVTPIYTSRWLSRKSAILIAMTILVIVGGFSILLYAIAGAPPKNSLTSNNATATANAHATSTALSATQEALIAATPASVNPYPPYTGTLAFFDPLNKSSSSGWLTRSSGSAGEICQFTNQAFDISVSQQNSVFYCPYASLLINFTFEAHMSILKGDCGGIIFRDNGKGNHYFFRVCQDGTYGLFLVTNNNFTNTLVSGSSPNIAKGLKQTNTIAVVASGYIVYLYVNNRLQNIDIAIDSTYSLGQVGLSAEDQSHATEVVYTNASAWTI